MMKILILGGTQFVGRHAAEEALARGHEVTIFNRGHAAAPGGVKSIVGDRLAKNGYSGLDGLSFDAVVDTWSTDPAAVESAVEALRGRVKQYIYVSTISVYNFEGAPRPYSENTPLFDPEKTEVQYFKDKVRGEHYALQSGVPTTLIRPGVILGPFENIGRLPWWLQRMAKGGKTLAPGPADMELQFIDSRDLAHFIVDAAEQKLEGPYNTLSNMAHITMGDFLEAANSVTGGKAQLCWLEMDKVKEANIGDWVEMPMWVAKASPADRPAYQVDVSKAIAAGLKIRPAKETIADTWEWMKATGEGPANSRIGLEPDKEKKALDKYCS
ncbi:reductase [Purpureocillium lavendulum]|uniref:Reductase n=1 Tax=Purpureocillium lavendulum TaxID=1247861 RepID=A0AB34G6A1_9HYPO|nr:reductase [Purpureocillium lavendulum]